MATIDILPAAFTPASPDITRIRPGRGWRAINLREVWQYRELLWFLTLRDIKLRYKQTALGVSWAILQPLFTMGYSPSSSAGSGSCRPTASRTPCWCWRPCCPGSCSPTP